MLKKCTVALLNWYRTSLSPRKRRPCCRFYPTCSAYALTAVEERGAIAGLCLAFLRLLRCHPWGGDGIDPVPLYHRKRRAVRKRSPQLRRGTELLSLCLKPTEKETKWTFN